MKNGLFKKSMSVFLSILMLMTCWVWIAPTQAEAINGTVYGAPALNGGHYNTGTTNAYGTPLFDGNTDRWFLWQNGDDWTKVFYPSQIYLDKTESLEAAGYYWNVQWHFGDSAIYRTFLGANIWGDHSQWSGKPERYYTMNNIFSNYSVDASLPDGYYGTNDGGVYGSNTGSSANYDLRIIGYGYNSQGSDQFSYNNTTHTKYISLRTRNSTNNATIYLKGNPAASYVGTTNEYNTSGDSFQGYGYAQKNGSTHAGGSNVYYKKGDDSSYREGEWIEMQWFVTIYDKQALNNAITKSNSIYSQNEAYANYITTGLDNYVAQHQAAPVLLKTRATNQTALDNQTTALENAAEALRFAASNANLLTAISQAEAILNSNAYTKASKEAVRTAYNAAVNSSYYNGVTSYSMDFSDSSTWNAGQKADNDQKAIDALTTALNAAIAAATNRDFDVTYENMFSFSSWVESASSVVGTPLKGTMTYDIAAGTITFQNSASNTQTYPNDHYSSNGFGNGHYNIALTPGETYTFEYKTSGGTGDQVHIFFFDAGGNAVANPANRGDAFANAYGSGNGKSTITFTAPENATVASVRFGTTVLGETVTFSDIVLYSHTRGDYAGIADWTTHPIRKYYTYNTPLGATLDVPVRPGYTFDGWWVDSINPNGQKDEGEQVTDGNGTVVSTLQNFGIAQDWVLYSEWTENKYNIVFDANGGEGSTAGISNILYTTETALTANGFTKDGYNFLGWSTDKNATTPTYTDGATVSKLSATSDDTVTLYAIWSLNKYTVEFVNEDGTVLQSGKVAYGTEPTYNGETPTKTADAQYTYTFAGWSPAISAVTGDATYTATYNETVNKYTVTWVDGNGNTLKTEDIAYGATPAYTGETPTKTATAQYTYTFNNSWSPAVASVTGNVTYTAQFDSSVNSYTVTWKNEDGSVLGTDSVEYGKVPAYTGEIPTKQGDAQYSYTFNAWTPEITEVTGDVTYTATFTQSANEYTVTWKNEDGTVLETDENILYGTMASYDGETPTKQADVQYTYTFKAWDTAISEVTGDVTYTATYTATVNEYTVSFVNEGGAVLQSGKVAYGKEPTYSGATPTKTATAQYTYTFNGWSPEITPVTGEATYTATYTETVNKYTVKFVDEDGTVLQSDEVEYGATPAYTGETPTKAATAQYTYTFAGWSPEIVPVTGTATYTATYDEKVNSYTVTFISADDTTAKEETLPYGSAIIAPANTSAKYDADKHYSYKWPEIAATVTDDVTYTEVEISDNHSYTYSYANESNHTAVCACGYSKDVEHTETSTVTEKASCVAEGVRTYTCSVCGGTRTEAIAKRAHNYKDNGVATKATCLAEGVMNTICTNEETETHSACTHESTRVIPKLEHSYTGEYKWNNSTTPYTHSQKCVNGCEEYGNETVCTFEAVVTAPTCFANGYTTYTCTVCKNSYQSDYTTREHIFVYASGNGTSHEVTCQYDNCNYTATENCAGGEATCTDKAVCDKCKAEYGSALNHDWADATYNFAADGKSCTAERVCNRADCGATETATATITSAVKTPATCTVMGWTTYTATFTETWAAVQYKDVQDISINADNHVGETYTKDENIVAGTCVSEKTWNEVTYCSDCNAKLDSVSKKGEIDSANHLNKTNHVKTDATCTDVGYTAGVFCEDCDKWISGHDEIPATNHENKVHHVKVDSTCMATGTIEYWSCPDCGKNFSDEECTTVVTDLTIEINPDAHSWGDWTQTIAPTCSAAGEDTRTCKHNAEHKETRLVDIVADAHKWETEYTVDKKASCDAAGSKSYHCEYCDAINVDSVVVIAKREHNLIDVAQTAAPTCTTPGTMSQRCANVGTDEYEACAYTATREIAIDANAHDWNNWSVTTPATCVAEGERTRVCKNDSNHVERESIAINKNNHAGLVKVGAKAAACEEIGWDAYEYCTDCDYTTYVEIPALEHDYEGVVTKEETCTEDGIITYTCKNDATHTYIEVIPAHHTDADDNGYCDDCNELVCAHTDTRLENVQAVTCLTEGYSGDEICNKCGNEIAKGHAIPATGHNYGEEPFKVINASCTSGKISIYRCDNCHETYSVTDEGEDALGPHTIVEIKEVEPTCDKMGFYVYYCTTCSTNVEVVQIPATGHVDANQDGVCDKVGCGGKVEIPGGSKACSCICHKEGWFMQLIYKIFRFFWKLFGIGKTCDCGFVHY